MITSAFTCTGPYAILILMGIKRVENRSMMPAVGKGRCAITCSKKFCKEEFGRFVAWAAANLTEEDFARVPSWGEVKDWPGNVVGCCDYEVEKRGEGGESGVWDEGYAFWWKLTEVVCFERPIACRGNVGMWEMDAALAAEVTAADARERCVGEKIATREDAARMFRLVTPLVGGNEGFFVLPLDEGRRVLEAPMLVSVGRDVTAEVAAGDVFEVAFKAGAKAIILAHNHPSGDTTPSIQDRHLTAALQKLGDVLGVRVLDHLIIGRK